MMYAPVERYGDCEVGTQDESRSNLPQGEVDSVDVEVHQAVPSQYGAFSSLSLSLLGMLQLHAVYKARTSVERTLWNVYRID
ncbi:hypothetical protein NQZ68_013752 [Dissostichus eleginoides]|nr:hypothetical protein NQZ68_013752 [Dissostichus eleginoides]